MKKVDIVLYGTDLIGEKFYWKYRNVYNIKYCIDSRRRGDFHGIKVFQPGDMSFDLKNEKIVVAVRTINEYANIRRQLIECGLKEFENFFWSHEVGRKLAIIYGNCHMLALEEYLNQTPEFVKDYTIRMKFVAARGNDDFLRLPAIEEMRKCSLFIAQDIRSINGKGVPSSDSLIKYISNSSNTIKIPNLYGYNLFFPQMDKCAGGVDLQHWNELSLNETARAHNMWEIGFLVNCDSNITRAYKCYNPLTTVLDAMRSKIFYDHNEIRKNFNQQIQRIQEREEKCDISISDFLLENYQNIQLFYDPYHPCEVVVCEKAKRILSKLGIKVSNEVVLPKRMQGTELFIYESVRKALGLKWRQEYIRINKDVASLQRGCLSREEFVNEVYAWNFDFQNELFEKKVEEKRRESRKIACFGAGVLCEMVMRQHGGFPGKCDVIIDNYKTGGNICGVPIISAPSIKNWKDYWIVIVIEDYGSVVQQLESYGLVKEKDYMIWIADR